MPLAHRPKGPVSLPPTRPASMQRGRRRGSGDGGLRRSPERRHPRTARPQTDLRSGRRDSQPDTVLSRPTRLLRLVPAVAQQSVSPLVSVIVTVVLLNVALMWATPTVTLRRTLRRFDLATAWVTPVLRHYG